MPVVYALIFTLAAVSAAVYAQWRMPFHTATARHALISRLILLVVGVAFGFVMATTYSDVRGWPSLVVFLAGFGLVHVPAAAILFLKRQQAKS